MAIFDDNVLFAVKRLDDNAYGYTIWQEVREMLNRPVSIGAIYVALRRLEARGLVTSHQGEATPERGGRPKRYFRLTEVQ